MSDTSNTLLLGSDKFKPNNTTASLIIGGAAFFIIMIFCFMILMSFTPGTPKMDYAKGLAIGFFIAVVCGFSAYAISERVQFTRNNPEAAAKLYMAENVGHSMRYMNPVFSFRG
jgi:hypothetical protein